MVPGVALFLDTCGMVVCVCVCLREWHRNVWGEEEACLVRAIICSTGMISGGLSGNTAFISVFVMCRYAVVMLPVRITFVPLKFDGTLTAILVGVLIAVWERWLILWVLVAVNTVGIGIAIWGVR